MVWSLWQIAEYRTSPYDVSYNKFPSCNPLGAEYMDYDSLWKDDWSPEKPLSNWNYQRQPYWYSENYQYLQETWKQEQMSSFNDFLRWYNNINVVLLLEAMQKLIAFHHGKDMDTLKLGCNLPNLANICLYKSIDAKFYLFTEKGETLMEKSLQRCWLCVVCHLSYLHEKPMLMKLWFKNQQFFVQTFSSDWC